MGTPVPHAAARQLPEAQGLVVVGPSSRPSVALYITGSNGTHDGLWRPGRPECDGAGAQLRDLERRFGFVGLALSRGICARALSLSSSNRLATCAKLTERKDLIIFKYHAEQIPA